METTFDFIKHLNIRHTGSTLNKTVTPGYILSPSMSSPKGIYSQTHRFIIMVLQSLGLTPLYGFAWNTWIVSIVLGSEILAVVYPRSITHSLPTSWISNELMDSKQNYTSVHFKMYVGYQSRLSQKQLNIILQTA